MKNLFSNWHNLRKLKNDGYESGFESIFMALNSMNNSSMTQLLGTQVVAYGNQFHYSGEGNVEIHYQSNVETSACKMIVKDESGSVVWAGPVENLKSGEGSFEWDGKDFDETH